MLVETTKSIVTNVLVALYQPFNFAIVISILFMFLYLFAQEHGWKNVFRKWINAFKMEKNFRKLFFFIFYTAMILFRTLLNRDMWANPVSDVIGVWGLHNEAGELTTEVIENLALFVPFTILMLWSFQEQIIGSKRTLWVIMVGSVKYTFLFSIFIEFLQLFLRLGTWQLSDIFYNTLGGMIGGLIYWFGYKITHRR